MMPHFSAAIFSTVSPRMAVCSKPMFATTQTSGAGMTFVESMRPPRPTSSETMSHCSCTKYKKAMAVMISKPVGISLMLSAAFRTVFVSEMRDSSSISSPFTRMRSWKRSRCGEV